MSVNDVIKKSVLETFGSGTVISVENVISFILCLAVSLLVGIFICFIYEQLYIWREGIFSRSFALTLVGMTMLTCMVTLAISTNVIISLGMVGSLSIVRYRTAIKDPMDLLYLFWAITSGIAIGAGMYLLVLCGLLFMALFLVIAAKRARSGQNYVMIINFEKEETRKKIINELKNIRWKLKSEMCRDDNYELTLHLIRPKKLMDVEHKISKLEEVSNVVLISFNGEYND